MTESVPILPTLANEINSGSETANSARGEHGGDTNSSLAPSDTASDNQGSESNQDDSNAPISSRGSTLATRETDSMSMDSRAYNYFEGRGHQVG
jgi:hypothetical protein